MPRVNFYLFFFFISLIHYGQSYQQSDYIVKTERAEVVSYNKKYVDFLKVENIKLNRTYRAFNITQSLKIDLGNNARALVQGYKFASNEYRLFPIEFSVNCCETINKNDFGLLNLYGCGNFTRCPMKKGRFVICNWAPDYAQFPPYIPVGSYMADMKVMYSGEEVMRVKAYATVEKIIQYKYRN